MNVLRPLASPSMRKPTKKPTEIPKTLNSLILVIFSSKRPVRSKRHPKKNQTPHKLSFYIVTNLGLP